MFWSRFVHVSGIGCSGYVKLPQLAVSRKVQHPVGCCLRACMLPHATENEGPIMSRNVRLSMRWTGTGGGTLLAMVLLIICAMCLPLSSGHAGAKKQHGQHGKMVTLKGVLWYKNRIALDMESLVSVRLVAMGANGQQGRVLAESGYRTHGQQVPLPFKLKVRPSAAKNAKNLRIFARIVDAYGRLRMISIKPYKIKGLKGNLTRISIELMPVRKGKKRK